MTAADHHNLFPPRSGKAIEVQVKDFYIKDVQVKVVCELAMRATLARGSMSLRENGGGLPPQSTVQDADVILADGEDLAGPRHPL